MDKSKTKGQYYQLIPVKILDNINVIVSAISPQIKGFSLDCLKEVISIVAKNVHKDNQPAPLKKEYVQALVPQGHIYLLELVRANIVQRSGRYIPGELSYQYSFHIEFNSRFIYVLLNNARLVNRIHKVYEDVYRETTKKIRGRADQVKDLMRLQVDESYRELLNDDINRNNYIEQSAIRIMNGEIFYSIDGTSGRFHSNVTNMPKELRDKLRINNAPLVTIDITNSQPYLSTIILTNPQKVSFLAKHPATALCLQTLQVNINKDVKNYLELVISGQFYEFLQEKFRLAGMDLTREETKVQVLRILFARNKTPKNPVNKKARQIFRENFPTVHKTFSKVRGSVKGDKYISYKRFAILLQRIESYLMLEVIVKRIRKEYPGTICITIHDSIMTGVLTNNIFAVGEILRSEFSNFIGFTPQLRLTNGQITNSYIRKGEGEGEYRIHYGDTTFVSFN